MIVFFQHFLPLTLVIFILYHRYFFFTSVSIYSGHTSCCALGLSNKAKTTNIRKKIIFITNDKLMMITDFTA